MNESRSKWLNWHYILLWIVAGTSLALNVLQFGGLYLFRLRARDEVAEFRDLMGAVEFNDFEVPVQVDETLPVVMNIPFEDTFHVTVDDTVPVSTTVLFEDTIVVPINTSIPINNDIVVEADIPLVGRVPVPIPIVTNVPVNLVVDIPVSEEIPVNTVIPINLEIDVPVKTEVPVDTEIPVVLDFPVTVPLDQLGFQRLLDQVIDALNVLADVLGAPRVPG